MISSPYLYDCLDTKRLKRIVNRAVEDLTPYKKLFDGIAFRGVSGAIVAPAVGMALNKKLVIVRDGCRTHSQKKVEGSKDITKYIILDDFCESGRTIRYIMKHMKTFSPDAEIVGRYLYIPTNRQFQIWNPETKVCVSVVSER